MQLGLAEEQSRSMASMLRRSIAAILSGNIRMVSSTDIKICSPLVVQQVSSVDCACDMKDRKVIITAMIGFIFSIILWFYDYVRRMQERLLRIKFFMVFPCIPNGTGIIRPCMS